MSAEGRGRVLLVDDEPALLAVMAETLEAAGFTVDTARDGGEALARVDAYAPDVVVADIDMPGMGGLELCRRLRAGGRDQIPFLFCSGHGSAGSRIEGLEAGADDYLVKPASPEELVLKLTRQVERVRRLRAAGGANVPVDAAALAAIEERLRRGVAVVRLGRFEIRGILGRGSMGTVLRAWDTKLERWVAIKTVRADAGLAEYWDGDLVPRLVSEAAMVARVSHPHVVAVHDVQDAKDAAYIVMELVDGPTLHDCLRRTRLAADRGVPLLAAVAGALAAAHAAHLLHRDVKPGNVLLGRDGAVKLSDFGIAALVSASKPGTVFGSPGYLPPEVLHGQRFTTAGDLFAFGALAYRCLAGRPAVEGRTSMDILRNTLSLRAPALREAGADVPGELEALVAALLEPDPERRLADAGLVAAELRRMCDLRGWRWTLPDLAGAATAGTESDTIHAQAIPTLGSATRLV